MEAQYKDKIKIMVEDNKIQTQTELNEINKRMKKFTSIIEEHDKAWRQSINNVNLASLKRKKLEVRCVKESP